MITQASCKLTNSLLCFFERQGIPVTSLVEMLDFPEEFLRDPHFWLDIHQTEKIYQRAARMIGDPRLGQTVGSQVFEMQSWGALDNVFKMMPECKMYYGHLERFLSYFFAPLENFKEIQKTETSVRIQFPAASLEFPHCFEFLRAVLENLPRYTGHSPAHCEWTEENQQMQINWDTDQPSLFGDHPEQPVMNPKLVKSMSALLESNHQALETKNRQILNYKKEIANLKQELQTQARERIYTEKMSSLAQLAAGVSHEINNPLSFVMSNLKRFEEYFLRLQSYLRQLERHLRQNDEESCHVLERLQEKLDVAFILKETPSMLTEASEGLTRVKEIVMDLSALAHPGNGRKERKVSMDLNNIIESSLKVFHDQMNDRIRVDRKLELKSPVEVFPVRMSQVVINLLNNAVQAIPEKGIIEIRTRQKRNQAVLEIADSGVGMDDSTLSHIFKPFFTTKEAGQGTGLGLSIAQSIIEMHHGHIEVKSEKGRGSRFTVTLPIKEHRAEVSSDV